jgi:hypothetical protein
VRITPAAVKRCIGRGDLLSRSALVRGSPLIAAYELQANVSNAADANNFQCDHLVAMV